MILFRALALAAGLGLTAGSASALTFATSVSDGFSTCSVAAQTTDRDDLCNGVGAPDVDGSFSEGGFISTGYFDELTFDFGVMFTGPITFWEISGGRSLNYVEKLSFRLVNSQTMNEAWGTVTNIDGIGDGPDRWQITTMGGIGRYDRIVVSDATRSRTGDGFDIDAIGVSPVPLPAGAALMLLALGSLGLARRR